MTTADAREDWAAVVAAMIEGNRSSEQGMRGTVDFLASLLDLDMLPAAGRTYLAEVARAVARGNNPFPKRKKPARSKIEVLVAVAREAAKRNAGHGDMNATYARVAKRLSRAHGDGMSPQTVQKYASTARKHLRKTVMENVAAGVDRDRVIATIAERYCLSPAEVKSYLL